MGQFVEIERDVVFTVEYSVRGAKMAVQGLMGTAKGPREVYKGTHDVEVMAKALKTILEDGTSMNHLNRLMGGGKEVKHTNVGILPDARGGAIL